MRVSKRGLVVHGEHLESSALGERTRRLRHEPIETGRIVVLGEVDDAGRRIDGDGLVDEASQALQRHRRGRALRRDLEDVAVRLAEPVGGTRLDQCLLAGQPRAPGRGSARAVARGAAQAGPRLDEGARGRIEFHAWSCRRRRTGRRPARCRRRPRSPSISWLRIRRMRPPGAANAAMPSCAPGVRRPSSRRSPRQLNET